MAANKKPAKGSTAKTAKAKPKKPAGRNTRKIQKAKAEAPKARKPRSDKGTKVAKSVDNGLTIKGSGTKKDPRIVPLRCDAAVADVPVARAIVMIGDLVKICDPLSIHEGKVGKLHKVSDVQGIEPVGLIELPSGLWARIMVSMLERVPDHERAFHTPEAKASLERSAEWLASHPPHAATAKDFDDLRNNRRGLTPEHDEPTPAAYHGEPHDGYPEAVPE